MVTLKDPKIVPALVPDTTGSLSAGIFTWNLEFATHNNSYYLDMAANFIFHDDGSKSVLRTLLQHLMLGLFYYCSRMLAPREASTRYEMLPDHWLPSSIFVAGRTTV